MEKKLGFRNMKEKSEIAFRWHWWELSNIFDQNHRWNHKQYIIIMALHLLRPSVHHFHCPFFLISALVLKVKRPKNPLRFLVVFSPRLSDEKLKEKKILRNFHRNRIYHGHCGTIAQFSYCFYYVSGISRRFRSILPSSFEP